MAIPSPGELYDSLNKGAKKSFNRQLAKYEEDPDTYDNPWESIEDYADSSYDEVKTPKDKKGGDVKARLTISSTSTINPENPRTLSAGYDPENYIMTVQFRDGTLWNYYDVPPEMWSEFSSAESKGRYLRGSGLDDWHSMGPAEGSTTSWFKKRAERSRQQQKENYGIQHGKRIR